MSITFAQTEASPCITQTRLDDSPADRAETLGRPHPHVEVQIADPATGETLPAGAVGEILTRGYHVMKGYFDNPAATRAAIDAAGWLHTGDLGSMDERGYYRIEGRVKEMIIRGGENIYPREIEQVLHAHPGVADVAVVGSARRPLGRAGRGVRPARSRPPRDAGRAGLLLPHPPGRPQDTAALGLRGRLPADRLRQGPEIRPPGAVHLRRNPGGTLAIQGDPRSARYEPQDHRAIGVPLASAMSGHLRCREVSSDQQVRPHSGL